MRRLRSGPTGLLLLVLLTAMVSESSPEQTVREQAPEVTMRVYFIPWGVQTDVSVTVDDIDTAGSQEIWFVERGEFSRAKQHPFVSRLRQLLQSRRAGTKVNDSSIRLKVEIGKETFYADQRGRVLDKTSGRLYALSRREMDEIEKSLGYFAGVVDIRASQGVRGTR